MEAIPAEKLNVAKMTFFSLFDCVENTTVGEKRKCRLPAFSPLPTVFFQSFLL